MGKRLLTAILAALLSSVQTASACTDFALKTEDNCFIAARTMEWSADLQSRLAIHGRGETRKAHSAVGEPLTWTSKFGYVGFDANHLDAIVDGVNEKGLSFGLLWMPSYTEYPEIKPGAKTLDVIDLGSWVLGSFQTVDEVKAALKSITISADNLPSFGGIPTAHMAVHDARGHHVVVEWIGGKQIVYDNPTGVLTNSPPLDWHLINLTNFMMVDSKNPKSIEIQGTVLSPPGQGGGFHGIPGDWTPPSRFVRTCAMLRFAKPGANTEAGINLAQHILNAVDIPKGDITTTVNGQEFTDYTQWAVIKDLTSPAMYFRTYDNLTLRKLDLKNLDFSKTDNMRYIEISGGAAWQAVD
jgi:choloylglycine hydrolase